MGRIDEIEARHVRAQGLQSPLGWCRACSEDWPCESAYLSGEVKRLRAALRNFAREGVNLDGYSDGNLFFLSKGEILEARAALSDEGSET